MPYMNIPFLVVGKKAIQNHYKEWFQFDAGYQYESGDIENHFRGRDHDLPNGNARRWDYIILKLTNNNLVKVVFAEPHPIKERNVREVLEKLEWLKYQIINHADLRHFSNQVNEYYWIYKTSSISPNSASKKRCDSKGLKITGIPLRV